MKLGAGDTCSTQDPVHTVEKDIHSLLFSAPELWDRLLSHGGQAHQEVPVSHSQLYS